MADIQNGRCHDAKAPERGPPFIQNGKIILQGESFCFSIRSCTYTYLPLAHDVRRIVSSWFARLLITSPFQIGWIVSGCFTIAAVVISFWLIGKHLQWYTNVCLIASSVQTRELTHLLMCLQKAEQRCMLIARHNISAYFDNSSCFKDIVRILFMVPLYAVISLASYLFWVRRPLLSQH